MHKEELKRFLRDKGLTYQVIGEELGVSFQAVSAIVNGQTTGATARYAFAKAVGLDVEDIWPTTVAA